jgi:hypothetical protein
MPTPKAGYTLKDGTRVPGTTTICGRWKESGGLLQWAFQQGKSGANNLYDMRDAAADVGTYIHALVEWHIEGEKAAKPEPDSSLDKEHVAKGIKGYENFLRWEDQTGLFVVSWEKPLVSEKYAFGGTPDGLFEFKGKIAMGDWKSSKRVYADNLLQLAAYWLIWEENFPDQPITDGAHIVRFSKDFGDFEHRSFDNLDLEKKQFILLREAYANDQQIKKRI